MPTPSFRRPRDSVYLTPLFRWLQGPLGRTWVQTLAFIMALQGLPLGEPVVPPAHRRSIEAHAVRDDRPLARKLAVALWRYLELGLIPLGAIVTG